MLGVTLVDHDLIKKLGAEAAIVACHVSSLLSYATDEEVSNDGFIGLNTQVFEEEMGMNRDKLAENFKALVENKYIEDYAFIGKRVFLKIR